MAHHVVHISEAEALSNFADVLARVRAGAEGVIEKDARAVAIVRPAGDEFACSPNPSRWRRNTPRNWATNRRLTLTSPPISKRSSRAASLAKSVHGNNPRYQLDHRRIPARLAARMWS